MTQNETRRWEVMISSTMVGMTDLRQQVEAAIAAAGMKPLWAEDRPLEYTESNEHLSYTMAEQCDLYLLIIADRYGTVDPQTHRSITHEEYLHAKKTPRKVRIVCVQRSGEIGGSHLLLRAC